MDIYLDDYHFHSTTETLPTIVKRPVQGLENAEQRLDVFDNSSRNGQTVGNILSGSSLITLEGSLRSINGVTDQEKQAGYEANRKALIRAVRNKHDAEGRPQPFALKITMPSGAAYQAAVYKQAALAFPLEYLTRGSWVLHLLNPRGIIESQETTSLTITLPQGGGIAFPAHFPLHFGASSGGAGIATNTGSADAYPVITFYGPMQHPVLYHQTLGIFLGLNLTLGSQDVVVVKPATPSVVQGTLTTMPSTPRMGSLTTGSRLGDMRIVPDTNLFALRADSYDLGRVEITFQSTEEGI